MEYEILWEMLIYLEVKERNVILEGNSVKNGGEMYRKSNYFKIRIVIEL